jgi:hypothetical protein
MGQEVRCAEYCNITATQCTTSLDHIALRKSSVQVSRLKFTFRSVSFTVQYGAVRYLVGLYAGDVGL